MRRRLMAVQRPAAAMGGKSLCSAPRLGHLGLAAAFRSRRRLVVTPRYEPFRPTLYPQLRTYDGGSSPENYLTSDAKTLVNEKLNSDGLKYRRVRYNADKRDPGSAGRD